MRTVRRLALLVALAPGCGDGSSPGSDTAHVGGRHENHTGDSYDAESSPDTAGTLSGDASPGGFESGLRVVSCGSVHGGSVLAPGPDLDGDGLGELAIGLPSADSQVYDAGIVLLLSGARLAAGVAGEDEAHSSVILVDAAGVQMPRAGFGADLRWVGDRDGDGRDELWTGAAVVAGARLRAGGTIAVTHDLDGDAVAFSRWDDLDGDGRDDWVFGFPERGFAGAAGGRGVLGPVLDGDFDGATTPFLFREAAGREATAGAGHAVGVLGQDLDHDGVREVVATLGNDVVVLNSRALLTWATYVDEAVRGRMVDAWGGSGALVRERLIVLGDVDGGGVDDLATLLEDGRVCVARGEDVVAGEAVPRCDTLPFVSALTQGEDVNGDGVRELWGVRTRAGTPELVAMDAVDLVRGVATELVTLPLPEDAIEPALATGHDRVYVPNGAGARWEDVDLGWSVPQAVRLSTADVAPVLRSLDVAEPVAPRWADLDDDGRLDMVLEEGRSIARPEDGATRLHVHTGARLREGGTRSACEADRTLVPMLDGLPARVTWIEGPDVLLSVNVDTGTARHGLVPLSALWSGDVDDRAVRFQGVALASAQCDLNGDGVEELLRRRNATLVVIDPVRLGATADPVAAELGAVTDADGWGDGCLRGISGTGDVLLTFEGFRTWLGWRLEDLVPGEISTEPWLALDGSDTYPYWNLNPLPDVAPWLPRDVVVDQVSGPRAFRTCVLPPEALAAGGTFVAAGLEAVCTGEHLGATAAWSGNVRGGDRVRDVVAIVRDATTADVVLRVWDGVSGAPEDLAMVAPRASGIDVLAAGPVPDLLGAGAPGAWTLTRDGAVVRGGVVGRPILAVSLARPR